jgi:hypothetical protein
LRRLIQCSLHGQSATSDGHFDRFSTKHKKILLEDSNEKVGREDTFKLTIGNEYLHETSNNNGVRIVNIATWKLTTVKKSKMFQHHKIHKYILTFLDGKRHNQIGHALINRRWQSSITFVVTFRGADCNTDHLLVIEKLVKWLSVSKSLMCRLKCIWLQKYYVHSYTLTQHYSVHIIWNVTARTEQLWPSEPNF